jgi:hypothetical protein
MGEKSPDGEKTSKIKGFKDNFGRKKRRSFVDGGKAQ